MNIFDAFELDVNVVFVYYGKTRVDKFLDEEVKMKIVLLCPVMYLFSVVHDNRCYPEVVKKIIFYYYC